MRLLEIYRKAPDLDLIVNEESNTNSQYFKSYAAVRIIRLRMYLSVTGLTGRSGNPFQKMGIQFKPN